VSFREGATVAIEYSIVIPTLGEIANLKQLLQSLVSLPDINRAEILIVLNPPSDKLQKLLDQFSTLNIKLHTSPLGVNQARNVGTKEASGKYIIFLDDDCAIRDPLFLSHHRMAHENNPWAFAVGGFYKNLDRSPIAQAYDEIQREWLLKNQFRPNGECQMLLGGHFSIKWSPNIPLFDSQIIYGGTETEYFFRLAKMGYRFKLIDLEVEHSPHLTRSILAKKAILQARTHLRLVREGLFISSHWFKCEGPSRNKYKEFYFRLFRLHSLKATNRTPQVGKIKRILSDYHQKICFYLENRNLIN
jgi:glycosyltransferase involved in cell wall biosynthesis